MLNRLSPSCYSPKSHKGSGLHYLAVPRHLFRERGFTLVELMISLALGVFLLGGILVFFGSTRATYSDVEQLSRIQESLRFVTDVVVRDARNAGFRDQLSLFGIEFSEIAEAYAEVNEDGNRLTIRYAGLGSCTEAFESVRIVENTYFVDNRNLVCSGESFRFEEAEGDFVQQSIRTEALATGLMSVSFVLVRNSAPSAEPLRCSFLDPEDLATACTGVIMNLGFEGLRKPGGGFDQRDVQLNASFRNVILDQVFGRG